MNSKNKGIALSYGYLLINMLCGLFLSSYLITQLGDTEYGIYQTISSFANYLVMFEFGTGTIMTRNISVCRGAHDSKNKINENISTVWVVTNILAFVIILASVVMYFSIDNVYKNSFTLENIAIAKKVFIVVVCNLVISFYAQSFTGLTLAFEKYSFGPILKTAKILIRTLLLGVLLIKYKYSLIIAIVDTFISLLTLLFSYFYCKFNFGVSFNFKLFNVKIFKSILPFSIALFLQTIINQANNSVDKFFIGILISPEAVASYSIALFVFSVFSSICTVPINIYAPQIAKDMSNGTSIGELSKKMSSASNLTAIVGGSILFGFVSVGRPFIAFLYGNEYLEYNVWKIAIILMAPSLLMNLLGVAINVIDVLGKRMMYSVTLGFTTIINILLTIIGIRHLGSLGAACATCFSILVFQFPIICVYYYKVIKIDVINMLKLSFIKIIPCQLIASIIAYLVSEGISNGLEKNLFISLIVGGLTYVFIFATLFFIADNKFRNFTQKYLNSFFNQIV